MGHGGLTEQETIRFLQELLVIYEDSNFQEQLHRLHRTTGAPRHALQLLAAEAPGREALLRRFGFRSLAEMKGCVRLHVARGSQRVAKLAQLTRSSLGLEVPIESAEQLLERQSKETQEALRCDRLGRAPLSARCQCLQRIEAELSEAQAEELKRLPEDLPLQALLSLLTMAGKGIPMRVLHMKELTEVPVAASLSPEVLWTSHVLPSLPVVRRKVPEALPKSLSFLEVAGHRMVQLKGRPSMSGSVPVFMCNPSMSLLFSDFLETMQWHTESKTICPFYLSKASLSELPELQEAIQALRIPEEFGTCFGDPVPNGVHTYIGCHRNTTSLHFDGYENLMLCVFGAKRIWLFPPSDARFLYPLGESISKPQDFTRSAIPPFTRFGDFSPEMQARFVAYGKAKVLEVQLRAGDLLYLPAGWWHCVQGSEEPNMILNWWFSVHPSKTGA